MTNFWDAIPQARDKSVMVLFRVVRIAEVNDLNDIARCVRRTLLHIARNDLSFARDELFFVVEHCDTAIENGADSEILAATAIKANCEEILKNDLTSART